MTAVTIKSLNLNNKIERESYVQLTHDSNCNALFFHTLPYLELIKNLMACDVNCYAAYHNDELVGALPVMIKNGEYGHVLNSLPFYGSYGGIIAKNTHASSSLKEFYLKYIQSNDFLSSVFVESPFSENSIELHPSSDIIINKICQRTQLPQNLGSFDEFIHSLGETVAGSLRKAKKCNVTITTSFDDIDIIYQIHKKNMDQVGSIEKPRLFFESVLNNFRQHEQFDIYTALYEGIPIAHLINFYHKNTVEYFVPITHPDYRNIQALSLIIEHAMRTSVAKGYGFWNWGTTPVNNLNLYKFKKKWNAQDFAYNTYVKLKNHDMSHIEKDVLLNSYKYFYAVPFERLLK